MQLRVPTPGRVGYELPRATRRSIPRPLLLGHPRRLRGRLLGAEGARGRPSARPSGRVAVAGRAEVRSRLERGRRGHPHQRRRSGVGRAQRAGDHRRVLRLPVPLLLQGLRHHRAAAEGVRPEHGAPGLQERSARVPPHGAARRRGRRHRARARRQRRVLELLPKRVRGAEGSQPRGHRSLGLALGRGRQCVPRGCRDPSLHRQGRQGPRARREGGRQRHTAVLHQRRGPGRRATVRDVQADHRRRAGQGEGSPG